MESKICTYTEPKIRLQLVRLQDGSICSFELRYNRRIIRTFSREEAYLARLLFCHHVSMICVDRNSAGLSKLT